MSWFRGVNIVLVLALGVELLRAEVIASTFHNTEVSLSHDWPSEGFRIGLKLHSQALWHPEKDEDANATKRAEKTKDPKALDEASKCHSSDSAPPDHLAPWHPSWNNSIAICAVMRQENITDVVEWLLYYKCVHHQMSRASFCRPRSRYLSIQEQTTSENITHLEWALYSTYTPL
jgi:hypothetical protein